MKVFAFPFSFSFSFGIPFRQFLPRGVEGLMAAGRSCINQGGGKDDPKRGAILRMRRQMFPIGEAVLTAAAMAVEDGMPPSKIDVRLLRKKFYAAGLYMGECEEPLEELGLV